MPIRAGADEQNRARVYAPNPVVGRWSISHYDTIASRNLLMEPAINADLTHFVKAPFDLTFELLKDAGWTFPDADGDGVADDEDCDANSNQTQTIVIGGVETGVPNRLLASGCTCNDQIAALARTAASGTFVSSVASLSNKWVRQGVVTVTQKGAIDSAAALSIGN